MTYPKTKLFSSKPSATNADWKLLLIDDSLKRSVDYLYQKYEIPTFISPYLLFKGINLDQIDDFISPKLKNLLPEPFLFKDLEKGVTRLATEV